MDVQGADAEKEPRRGGFARRGSGPVNRAEPERARASSSGALIATGVILAAAAAAAYAFGPKIAELLGLGAAVATLSGGAAPESSDQVDASVFAPPSVARGDVARVQVFLSKREQRDQARAIAQEQDPSAGRRAGKPLSVGLPRGAEVEVALVALDALGREAFDIDGARETLVWDGEPVSVDFFIEARAGAVMRHHRLAAILLRDGRPVGELRFTLQATEAEEQATPPALDLADADPEPYRNMFFSYAREDLDAVRLVARSYRLLEQDFFWDVDSLEPGTDWEAELKRRIDEADVFILFWSQAAHDSEWVKREVEMALANEAATGKPRFMPFPIDGPPPVTPWESIASRHIGDPLYYRVVRAAQKNAERQPKT